MATEVVYSGYDNPHKYILKEDEVALTSSQMSAITKVAVRFSGETYDSDDFPDAFDWSTERDTGTLSVKLGRLGLPDGRDRKTELIIYDSVNTNGIVWATLNLNVVTI